MNPAPIKENEEMDGKRDYPNSGILFREPQKRDAKDRDYKGGGEMTCSCGRRTHLWISGWVKEGRKGKFLSLSFKAKDAQADTSHKPADADLDDLI
jgi:hypothetical protein